jgi:16S rRNA processing protein RimM
VSSELLAVGRISSAHGVRGEVSVHKLTEVEDRFARGSILQLEDGRRLTVDSSRPHQRSLLVKFEQVADRTQAEALRGQVLLVPSDASPDPPEGAFWVHQVVGLEVVTEDGRSLGKIVEVQANPANDLWVTESGTLLPAIRDLVVAVDVEAGRVTVREMPGLESD